MLRRLRPKKKSLQRKTWCMGSFLCREVDEAVYADVRHRLQRCGGVETRVKLSAKGWTSGGGRNMPSQSYGLHMISAVEPDTVFVNVLLCVFKRVDTGADFPYETIAYKFDSEKDPSAFSQLFKSLSLPGVRNGGSRVAKKESVLPGRDTAGRGAGKQPVLMPGRPTHGVMGAVAHDRWAAKDRTMPRLFASRSLDDLLEESASTSLARGRRLSAEHIDPELPGDDDDDQTQTSTGSTPSVQPVILPADTILEGVNGALDGAWWSEDDEVATRTKDIGVSAAFPDATDRLREHRRPGLESWVLGSDVACQAYVLPAAAGKPTAVKRFDDEDDYDDDADEFKWVFSSDEEDDQPVFDASFSAALAHVSREQAIAAKSRQFSDGRAISPAAAAAASVVREDSASPSHFRHNRYSRRVDQQQMTGAVYATQQNLPATAANRKPVSTRRYRVPSLHVTGRPSGMVVARTASSHVRRSRSDTAGVHVARSARPTSVAGTGAYRRPGKTRLGSTLSRSGADRRRRAQSMSEYRYQYAANQQM